ncbi:hypothetical protein GCM10027187_39940 [Streptosporangium sandarakinum]|uniref:Uncharacterized protein n=1 Tax=Streptosporangium sandarakinum TaxID=1260955 RepID=A0A852VC96_9ACTN|nr:hypothetical protein [Streptosporangium sandarakinum]NYF44674.1 hypothetical protein [Streptosporangium sandarakinum]
MFEVHGYIDGVAYAVTVGRARPEAAATTGVVSGSPIAVTLLSGRQGRTVPVPHQTPIVLDTSDPVSVLTALRVWTQVVREVGDVPAEMT